MIGFGIKYADHRKLKLNLALSGENKINVMFIRIRYYDAKKINILASKSCKNKYSDPNKIDRLHIIFMGNAFSPSSF